MTLPQEYIDDLKDGYFDKEGILKTAFVREYAEGVALKFTGMTSTQLRNYYNHVRNAAAVYQQNDNSKANEQSLLIKVKKLQSIVSYNKGRGINVPQGFFDYINVNLDACSSARDIVSGFLPHFETIVGFFKYNESRNSNKTIDRNSNKNYQQRGKHR